MKKYPAFFGLLLWVVAGLVWSSLIHAQAPPMMSYQAVVRNSVGDLVTNSPVGVRVTIIQGSATGNAVFTEVYTPSRMTNAQGLMSLEIGTGSPQVGTFAGINWAAGPFFLQTEVDLSGGTNYQVLGTQQLLTVPYSYYSNSSGGLSYPGGTASLASTGNGILYLCNGIIQTTPCLPSVLTSAASAITSTGATTGGNVTADGGAAVTARGVAYGTVQNPTTANSTTSDGTGTGVFTSMLTGLTSSTLYYVRAYATNSVGTAYGNVVSFTTSAAAPSFTCGTSTVSDVDNNTYNTIQIGTQCWTQSNLKVSKYRNGDNIPTGLSNSAWQNTTSGTYAIYNNDPVNDGLYGKLYNHYAVTDSRGLCPTGWHVPSDAEWTTLENQLGGSSVAGGALKSTATQPTPGGWASPNTGATNSSGFSALPGGLRSDLGAFVFMTINGFWWSSSASSGSDAWFRYLSNDLSVIYRYSSGRSSGFSVRCLKDSSSGGSSASLPTVSTTTATSITSTGATTGGNVTADGGAMVTARGVAYGTAQSPITANSTTSDGTGTGVFTSTLTGLTASTLYYVRAYATNAVGTAYGSQVSFTTSAAAPSFTCGTSTVTDVDSNTYNTVQIGTQCWTQSNLKVSKYRNGDNIPTGLNNFDWQNTFATNSGAYAIYNNDPVNDGLYGKLYNHYAVTDSRGLCPTGWHVPSDAEWTTLENQLGGSSVAGGALKSTAIQPTPGGWNSPNTGATNSSGFSALPGGLRYDFGGFNYMTSFGYWWSSSVSSGSDAWRRILFTNDSNIVRNLFSRTSGFSVRCCRD